MRNILFPTDFSKDSQRTLRYALSLANMVWAQVTILNAYLPTNSPRRPLIEEGTIGQQVLKRLKEFAITSLEKESFGKVNFIAREGFPSQTIIEASQSSNCDLIIMNRSENYDWLSRLLGSTPANICFGAHCPVLVIPPRKDFQGIHNVLIANDENIKLPFYKSIYFNNFLMQLKANLHSLPVSKDFPSSPGKSLGILNQAYPFDFQRKQEKLWKYIDEHSIDLLVLRITPKNLLQEIYDYYYTLQNILKLDIPILVFNDHAIRRKSISLMPQLSRSEAV